MPSSSSSFPSSVPPSRKKKDDDKDEGEEQPAVLRRTPVAVLEDGVVAVAEEGDGGGGGCNSAAASFASASAHPPSATLSNDNSENKKKKKKERGRFKKLWKRATSDASASDAPPEKQVTGIASAEEWRELRRHLSAAAAQQRQQQQLQGKGETNRNGSDGVAIDDDEGNSATTSGGGGGGNNAARNAAYCSSESIGPCIRMRQRQGSTPSPTTTVVIDAADHRDILFRLLLLRNHHHHHDHHSQSRSHRGREKEQQRHGGEQGEETTGRNDANNNKNSSAVKRRRSAAAACGDRDNDSEGDDSDDSNGRHSDSSIASAAAAGAAVAVPKRWPFWASVHNPAAAEHVAVLLVQVETQDEVEAVARAVERVVVVAPSSDGGVNNSNNDDNDSNARKSTTKKRKKEFVCFNERVRWFSNLHNPKSASSALLYASTSSAGSTSPKKKKPRTKKKNDNSSSSSSAGTAAAATTALRDIHRTMLSLAVTRDQLVAEGYPIANKGEHERRPVERAATGTEELTTAKEQFLSKTLRRRLPRDVSYDESLSITEHAKVAVTTAGSSRNDGDDDDNAPSSSLPPYVSTSISSISCESDGAKSDSGSAGGTVFGLDCEMVQTPAGLECARVTLVRLTTGATSSPEEEFEPELCFDQLVRPKHRVIDYLTKYSGITAELLEKSQEQLVELEQVQASLLSWVAADDILCGHSLENDLKAVRVVHNRIVDAALLFRPTGAKFKYSLQTLSTMLLRKRMRDQSQSRPAHHCSQEDAETALSLAVRRAKLGPSFGITKRQEHNIVHLVTAATRTGDDAGAVVCVGPSAWLQEHVLDPPSSAHALALENIGGDRNRHAIAAWLTNRRKARLVVAHLVSGGNERGIEDITALLEDLVSKMPSTTIVGVAVQAAFDRASKGTEQRKARLKPRSTLGWTEQDQAEWLKSIHACRTGRMLWIGARPTTT